MSTPVDPKLKIAKEGNEIVVSWEGGIPPFQLQQTPVLSENPTWENVGDVTMAREKRLPWDPAFNAQRYFRVQHSIMLADADENGELFWSLPELP